MMMLLLTREEGGQGHGIDRLVSYVLKFVVGSFEEFGVGLVLCTELGIYKCIHGSTDGKIV
jgi:hypothetical protein